MCVSNKKVNKLVTGTHRYNKEIDPSPKIIQHLLDNGASVDAVDTDDRTALHHATKKQSYNAQGVSDSSNVCRFPLFLLIGSSQSWLGWL
jgi:ankyrin repeat protein